MWKLRFILFQQTSGGYEPYFRALDDGFMEWRNIVQPRTGTSDNSDDECFVVIYTDEPDEG